MTVEARLEKMLAEINRDFDDCDVMADDLKNRLAECMEHVQSGKSLRLILGKFLAAKRDRNFMERLVSRMNTKLKTVDEMIKKHSGELGSQRTKELTDSTASFLAVLDGLHRISADLDGKC